MIELHDVSFQFDQKTAINAVSRINAQIRAAQITAIIGESGSGKSTLLRIIFGLLKVDKGAVFYKRERVLGPHEKLIPGHPKMRMVTQNFDDLNPYATVWDNVSGELSNADLTAKQHLTEEILEKLKIQRLAAKRIVDLSGGEKQRVAIARALISAPEVLLMDEPFNQIDASFRESLQEDLRRIVDNSGLTVVLVSHDPSEVMALADHLIVLKKGHAVAAGSPRKLFERPPNRYTTNLLTRANILSLADARKLNLPVGDDKLPWVGIHLHQLKITHKGGDFKVTRLSFKGPYEEVEITNGVLSLKVQHYQTGVLRAGESVGIEILNCWQMLE